MLFSFKLMDRCKTVILSPDFILESSGKCPSPEVLHTIPVLFCFAFWNGFMKPKLALNFSSFGFHLPRAGITGRCPWCPASSCSYLAQSTHQGPGCWVFKFSVRPALTAACRLPLCSARWAFFPTQASDLTLATLLSHLWRAWLVLQQQISVNTVNMLALQNTGLPPVTLMNLTVKSYWRNSSQRLRRIWLGG